MHWTFKDRYQPHLTLNIDYDMPATLKRLGDTFEEFRTYEMLEDSEKDKSPMESFENFPILAIHTALSSVYTAYNEKHEFDYEAYEKRVRKHLIDVHPAFAAKAFADCICKLRYQQSLLVQCESEQNVDMIFEERE
ncbi:hypothetical protein JFT58_22710 [Pseudomonas sp. MF6767]|uniref:hypothetical protein n=1 Tax=Pseudomonas sp. MF6767 TaxID=2797531 RepID=UPI0018E7CABA|nr:hypothetical protein [Pseudomonas sp. MF6767]MBJ2281100.1 hypothetical protein [Pseudomonas sp. MF6767]